VQSSIFSEQNPSHSNATRFIDLLTKIKKLVSIDASYSSSYFKMSKFCVAEHLQDHSIILHNKVFEKVEDAQLHALKKMTKQQGLIELARTTNQIPISYAWVLNFSFKCNENKYMVYPISTSPSFLSTKYVILIQNRLILATNALNSKEDAERYIINNNMYKLDADEIQQTELRLIEELHEHESESFHNEVFRIVSQHLETIGDSHKIVKVEV
jgi:hypothetical protein